ncbi:kinase-like domain-containing protein [Rhizophagus clarus]|nr:kinase-like domain-containing protein [Rhizophagus clarus]
MIITLKSLDNSKNITLELVNKIKLDYEFYGITQNPETVNYIMVLNEKCKKCNYTCNIIHFQQNFVNWTSDNEDIDKFIQDTQLLAHGNNYDVFKKVLEWLPYDRFLNIKYIAKGGFGKIYKATWIDGYINRWNSHDGNWKRYNENMFVALKSLDDSKNATLEFMNEVMLHNRSKINNSFIIGFYGITQDPKTKNYMMVLDYAKDGSLRNYLNKKYSQLSWHKRIVHLHDIIIGLELIHEKGLIHRDLHVGNILKLKYYIAITDMGLCKPVKHITSENAENNVYGVLPYVAPEILRGQNYNEAADIYSFGIIMYEVISGLPPYHNLSHNDILAVKICQGLRPRFNIKVPQLIVYLIKRCLDANPINRPTAREIKDTLFKWKNEPAEFSKMLAQIKEENNIYNKLSNNGITAISLRLTYKIHSEAIYTSRLLNFNNLPVPKNSSDYYEQNDNIISTEFTESLQIDISQLNINF